MYITKIELINFRNYARAEFLPGPGITVLHGDNAQGKTSALEAVYLCCTGRSHKTSRDRELIMRGEERGRVRVEARRSDGPHDVDIQLFQSERKKVQVGGRALGRSGELMGHVTGVLFSPEDLRMIKDGPAERRRFIDMELSQIRPAYYYALQRYNRALQQRGRLLREGALETLDVWDEQLAAAGAQIIAHRRAFLQRLDEAAAGIHLDVSGGREHLRVAYQVGAKVQEASDGELKQALLRALLAARDVDARRMTTSAGPHRDDLLLELDGMDVRAYGSQGQQRTCALSLKLSELQVMRDETGEWPVLMLDDVMSELDPHRRRHLLGRLEGVQTLVTCTDMDDLAGARVGKTYHIHAGAIAE